MAGSCGGASWLGSVYRPKGTGPASGAWWLRMRMGLIEHAAAPLGLLLRLSAGPGADTPVPVPSPSPICPGRGTGPRSPTCQNRPRQANGDGDGLARGRLGASPILENRGRRGRGSAPGTLPRPRFPWGSAPWAPGGPRVLVRLRLKSRWRTSRDAPARCQVAGLRPPAGCESDSRSPSGTVALFPTSGLMAPAQRQARR